MRWEPLFFVVAACANAQSSSPDDGGGMGGSDGSGSGSGSDASCGTTCDTDHDGVVDGDDQCANTPSGAPVNGVGCADSQVTPMLEESFPPFGLTWTPTGNLGRAGGLTWTYTGIERADRFHIDWVVCDDPATPCGISLDGPIDLAPENFQFSAGGSNLATGILMFTNSTRILLADTTTPMLAGRLTVTIVDGTDTPIPFVLLSTLDVTGRLGQYGAEITGTGYKVVAIAEVQPVGSTTWTPYLDYYDAAPTPTTGGSVVTSFGASFYSE